MKSSQTRTHRRNGSTGTVNTLEIQIYVLRGAKGVFCVCGSTSNCLVCTPGIILANKWESHANVCGTKWYDTERYPGRLSRMCCVVDGVCQACCMCCVVIILLLSAKRASSTPEALVLLSFGDLQS